MPNAHDANDEFDWTDDWKDEEEPSDVVEMPLPVPVPAVEAKDVKIIVLDPDVLIDRNGPP
ncbi:hypothetical protein C0991_001389 [Blastosporella zonata]|nr:hypothetical protein C0991_001389 [Blastosporella zonata]